MVLGGIPDLLQIGRHGTALQRERVVYGSTTVSIANWLHWWVCKGGNWESLRRTMQKSRGNKLEENGHNARRNWQTPIWTVGGSRTENPERTRGYGSRPTLVDSVVAALWSMLSSVIVLFIFIAEWRASRPEYYWRFLHPDIYVSWVHDNHWRAHSSISSSVLREI